MLLAVAAAATVFLIWPIDCTEDAGGSGDSVRLFSVMHGPRAVLAARGGADGACVVPALIAGAVLVLVLVAYVVRRGRRVLGA